MLRVCRGSLVGDFDEVERLQAGIRTWLLRTARSGRHELRDGGGPAVLPLLCAAAFGPALADGAGRGLARGRRARMGVLSSVGADVLALLLDEAAGPRSFGTNIGRSCGPESSAWTRADAWSGRSAGASGRSSPRATSTPMTCDPTSRW